MKRLILAVCAAILSSALCSANPCGVGTLTNYVALGAGGCTIDGSTLFNFQTVPGSSTGAPISTADVTVTPFGGPSDPGLSISTSLTAPANAPLELTFTYQISGASYFSSAIALSGASETGDGGVTEIQNYCAGGSFGSGGFTGCSGVAGSLLTLDGIQQSDEGSFAGAPLVSVTNDFELDGGTVGSASGGTFTNQFAAASSVPEPATWLFAGIGISCIALIKLRTSALVPRKK